MALSKNALIHAVYNELKGSMSKEDATYAARRIVEICRPDATNDGSQAKDGPSYADIQERWNLDRNNGASD